METLCRSHVEKLFWKFTKFEKKSKIFKYKYDSVEIFDFDSLSTEISFCSAKQGHRISELTQVAPKDVIRCEAPNYR